MCIALPLRFEDIRTKVFSVLCLLSLVLLIVKRGLTLLKSLALLKIERLGDEFSMLRDEALIQLG